MLQMMWRLWSPGEICATQLFSKSTFKRLGGSMIMPLCKESSFIPEKVLIVSKLSRYHHEKLLEPHLNEEQFKTKLLENGFDYEVLRASYEANETVKNKVIKLFKKLNVKYEIVDRINLDPIYFDWADLILPIGGDGTFLMASNLIRNNQKPIMGINSYPTKSQGYLMLPPSYTNDIPKIFDMLKSGHYKILMRRRIRTVLKGKNIHSKPFHIHQKSGLVSAVEKLNNQHTNENTVSQERMLPCLALNEVFVGETLSAKTSTLLVKVDHKAEYDGVKCSGLCISTGTGSTSWYKTINSITSSTAREILNLANYSGNLTDEEIRRLCTTFNDKLHFDADDPKLAYILREIIINDARPIPRYIHQRGFCTELFVRSQCSNAALVIDGGIAYPFDFGTSAVLQTFSKDSLKSIMLP